MGNIANIQCRSICTNSKANDEKEILINESALKGSMIDKIPLLSSNEDTFTPSKSENIYNNNHGLNIENSEGAIKSKSVNALLDKEDIKNNFTEGINWVDKLNINNVQSSFEERKQESFLDIANAGSNSPKTPKSAKRISKTMNSQIIAIAPLEIINELNGDLSKDSVREKIFINNEVFNVSELKSEVARRQGEKEGDRNKKKESNTMVKNISSKSGLSAKVDLSKPVDSNNTHNDFKRLTISEIPASNNNINEFAFSGKNGHANNIDTFKGRSSSVYIDKNEEKVNKQNEEKKLPADLEKPKFNPTNFNNTNKAAPKKSNIMSKDTTDTWRSINITSVIPEYKLLNSVEDELLLQGELFRYTHPQVVKHGAQLYSSKFCVITKADFKTKEAYLRMQNPIFALPFFSVLSANRVKFPINTKDKNKNYVNFFIELVKENENQNQNGLVEKRNSKFDVSLSKIANESENKSDTMQNSLFKKGDDFNDDILDYDLDNNFEKSKQKNASLHEDRKEEDRSSHNLTQDRSLLENPRVLIFASLNEEIVNRWLSVINYFITN